MRCLDFFPGLAAIARFEEVLCGERVDGIAVLWVGEDVPVIILAATELEVVVHQAPGLAGIVGAVHAAVLSLHGGPDAVRIHGRDGDADLSLVTFGEAVLECCPSISLIRGLVEFAAWPDAVDSPGCAQHLPRG